MDIQVTLGILVFLLIVLFFPVVRSKIKKEPVDWRVFKVFLVAATAVTITSLIILAFT
jgi:amino acid transporter